MKFIELTRGDKKILVNVASIANVSEAINGTLVTSLDSEDTFRVDESYAQVFHLITQP